jgi:hypothetical protein
MDLKAIVQPPFGNRLAACLGADSASRLSFPQLSRNLARNLEMGGRGWT